MTSTPVLTIGTRGSPLALRQAEEVRDRLVAINGLEPDTIAIKIIKTSGDIILDRPLSEVGGKGLFTKEIEKALAESEIDIAVHSAKDVATEIDPLFALPAFLPREDVRDAFLSLIAKSPDHLPEGAVIGSSSLRRRAQMKRFRPDFRTVEFRGNVQTRLKKLADGVADATLLAMAGLNRLGEAHRVTHTLDVAHFPPAPAQGAIVIETRADDGAANRLVEVLDDPDTRKRVEAERAFLKVLDGSCRTPIAALTTLDGDNLTLFGQILSPDGSEVYEDETSGDADRGRDLGTRLGEKLLAAAGPDFIERLKQGQYG
ncbi:hydroxymethylbilane synthase [Pelagibacterium halotolerans]|uniref:Porphobilinogen deaminase n=1 Tax=Pelagibacterium halotolerans (strain DSM 22347 / JCM 15775 / CGMCC 1.7692 / B2) TaxID=1082931 RepID=G4R6U9_PELHB|nr:Porphobilinogen deaminase [Pelagibacterium halotolerans B2]QJR20429.1 hydroxymethylbilane synthase [Pelagibacterium halotolerans]